MNGSGFEKVLLSAILTSCSVFSVLTLAFLPRRAEPVLTEPTVSESIEDINHRDVVIRHIGLSIVLSVGTGITTAELMRKWGRSQKMAPDGRQVLSAQTTLQAVDLPEIAIVVNGLVAPVRDLTNGLLPADQLELQAHDRAVLGSDRDRDWDNTALPSSLFQSPLQLATEEVNWFPPAQPDNPLPASLTELSLHPTDWAPTWHPILVSREQYQTCRIQRLDAAERLFAILFDGQYYRFVKTAIDREQALSIASRLDHRGEPAVITQAEERYTVWALETEGSLETLTFSVEHNEACCYIEQLEPPNLVAA